LHFTIYDNFGLDKEDVDFDWKFDITSKIKSFAPFFVLGLCYNIIKAVMADINLL
jgi:hypothetical protein